MSKKNAAVALYNAHAEAEEWGEEPEDPMI